MMIRILVLPTGFVEGVVRDWEMVESLVVRFRTAIHLLIIQDPRKDPKVANDSPFGGCRLFDFDWPIDLVNVGLLHSEAN
jgi:hypothetical protein